MDYGARHQQPLEMIPMSAESRLIELKLELPPAPKPMGVYKPVVIAGNMAYVSGHGPLKADKTLIVGRVGADNGIGARSAVGAPVLPGNIPVEIEAIFEIA